MSRKKKKSGSESEATPPASLRRKRAISVVPEAGDEGDDDSAEARKRMFTEPGEADEPPVEGVSVKRRWLSQGEPQPDEAEGAAADTDDDGDDDEPVVDVEEERATAAREAAAALRDHLRTDGKPRRSAAERARALEAEARAQGRRSPEVARARKAPAPEPDQAPAQAAGKPGRAATLVPRRRRGTTEMLPPPAWQRHDALVVIAALLLMVGGAALHRHLARPALVDEAERGLAFARPASWLVPARIGRPIAGLAVGGERGGGPSYHVAYQSPLASLSRLEILISERPANGNLRSALALARVARHGEAHWADESDDRTIGGRDWVRTPYRYTFKEGESDEPIVAHAIEYATLNGRLMYVVTMHGADDTAADLEELVMPTLAVDPNHPAAIGAKK